MCEIVRVKYGRKNLPQTKPQPTTGRLRAKFGMSSIVSWTIIHPPRLPKHFYPIQPRPTSFIGPYSTRLSLALVLSYGGGNSGGSVSLRTVTAEVVCLEALNLGGR